MADIQRLVGTEWGGFRKQETGSVRARWVSKVTRGQGRNLTV